MIQAVGDLDLSGDVQNTLVVITAGVDSCEPDALARMEQLGRRLGIEVDLILIGLGVADETDRVQLHAVASELGGAYFDAFSPDELRRLLELAASGELPPASSWTPAASILLPAPAAPSPTSGLVSPPTPTAWHAPVLPTPVGVQNGAAIQLDVPVSGSSTQPGAEQHYFFTGSQGQVIFFDVLDYSAFASQISEFRLDAPDGSNVFTVLGAVGLHGDTGAIRLGQSGVYSLSIRPMGDFGLTCEFVIRDVAPFTRSGQAVSFGSPLVDRVQLPGQMVSYPLPGEAGQTLYIDFRQLTGDEQDFLEYRLTDPDAVELGAVRTNQLARADLGPVTLEKTGTYHLELDPAGDATPEYEFVVWELAPALLEGGAVEFGQPIQSAILVPGQVAAYEFEGRAGQNLIIDLISVQGLGPDEFVDFSLQDPQGRELLTQQASQPGAVGGPGVELPETGSYILLVDPGRDSLPNLEFVLYETDPSQETD